MWTGSSVGIVAGYGLDGPGIVFGACKRTQLSLKNCEIAGQIPLVPSFASGVRCVSGQYAASSGGKGGKRPLQSKNNEVLYKKNIESPILEQ
jgi:hypothetical protein